MFTKKTGDETLILANYNIDFWGCERYAGPDVWDTGGRVSEQEHKLLCGHFTAVHGASPNAETLSPSDVRETLYWEKLFLPRRGIIVRTVTAERQDRSAPSRHNSISIHALSCQNLVDRHPVKKCHLQAPSSERQQKMYKKTFAVGKLDLINSHKNVIIQLCLGCSTDVGLKLSGVDVAVVKQKNKFELWKYQCINIEHKIKMSRNNMYLFAF